ncbi:MAG: Gfo/Idh/MocA family oxidoreductase [Silicimonas sp.]|nr:Gfo/Idh/MocA family oxidoreductase [Silicimonas sp.]
MMRAGLIGLGMVANTYGAAFRNSKTVALARVFAPSPESRARFQERFADLGARTCESLQDMADDPRIDFVVVATPPNARIDTVHVLAGASKPILMEKPIERTLKAATVIVDYCEAKGLPFGIMLQHRARPIVSDMKQQLAELGPIIAVEVNVPWWRPQSYYDEPGRGSYQRDGGGVLICQAIHALDLMLSLTGPVEEVTAMCATTGFHRMEAEDFVVAGLLFENGAVGQLFATTASYPGQGETLTIHCKHGTARLAAGKLYIDLADGKSRELGQSTTSGSGADPMAFTSDWHQAVIEEFADALAENREPSITGRAALKVHHLIDAIEKAGASGERVRLKEFSDAV